MEVHDGEELQNALSFTDENFCLPIDTVMKRKRVEQRPIRTMTHQQRFY